MKEGNPTAAQASASSGVSVIQQARQTSSSSSSPVDAAFERLFGYKFGTTFELPPETIQKDPPKKKSTTTSTTAQQLVEIFGRTRAARILGNLGLSGRKRRLESDGNDDSLADRPTKSSRKVRDYKHIELPETTKKTITETKVFAGQTIQTTTTVSVPSTTGTATTTAAAAAGKAPPAKPNNSNLDQVLSQIAGPSKMNTVEKTSNDWEQLKESDQQLKEELEKKAQGKDAFLVKQDFLNRVDQRKFELEREERERERAKRTTT